MYPVLILAAGTSQRMGEMKPFVKLYNGKTLLEHLLDQYKKTCAGEITIVLNSDGYLFFKQRFPHIENEINIKINPNPDRGRMESLRIGFEKISSEGLFLQNIDNPFVNNKLIEEMSALLMPDSYVVPVYENIGGHPILLSNRIFSDVRNSSVLDVNFKLFLNNYKRINYKSLNSEILYNLNTPEDLLLFNYNIDR